jgi:hypothetical protein
LMQILSGAKQIERSLIGRSQARRGRLLIIDHEKNASDPSCG